jgi:pyruvate dehydrogenase (quinone)
MPQALGVQSAFPDRQVIAFAGDGGLAMLMGELLTLRQLRLPVKIVLLDNGALGFVELEMKADGIVNYGTDLDNPDFAAVARAVGIHGVRVEEPAELDSALRDAFTHPGPALVDVRTLRHEVAIPPRIALHQAAGFTLWATRSILNGDASAVVEVARTNLRQLARE